MFGSKPGLERIKALLDLMGNPQQGLRYVHLAGTNGKGSTSLMIANVLIEEGYRVGRFISPHLHSYFERITVNGQEIEAKRFLDYLLEIEAVIPALIEKGISHPTEFEVLTAVALQYFQDEKLDMVVLEVGMGGIYDSTNVIVPEVSVITGIDYDHTAYLGNTLEEIARNKAGIIKFGIPVVTGDMDDRALKVLKDVASDKGALLVTNNTVQVSRCSRSEEMGRVNLHSSVWQIKNLAFSLLGDYQLKNLATAVATLQLLQDQGYALEESSIRTALANLKMPGRMELVRKDPTVLLDAAHNPQGAQALAASLNFLYPEQKKIIVCGFLNDKEFKPIIDSLVNKTDSFIITRPEGPRGSEWRNASRYIKNNYPHVELFEIESIIMAVEKALELVICDKYIVITGSFYVLGAARQFFVDS